MSRSTDKRIVEMELNNRSFESNAKTSINTINKLKAALAMENAEDGFYRVEKAAASINLQPIISSLDDIKGKFSALGIFGVETMKRITNAALDAGEKMWASTFGQIKSGGSSRALNIANSQFKLEGLGVAWKEAAKDINQAVDGTAYSFDAAANTAAQLSTAGIQLGEAYGGMAHSLRAVSGIAAMTNSSYEEIGYIFSQIASAGRLMGQDAMQISTRGINVTATLAKQLNKTTEEIQDMQRKGEISFAMFAEAMNDAFGDQATKANNTFQGALSNVKSALSRIGEIWYGPFYNAAITPLNKIRVAINQIKKAFDDGDESTRDFKDRLTDLMNIVSNIFSWLTENTDLTFFNNIASGANMVLDALNDIGHAIEKTLGIFKTDKQVSETEKLTSSVNQLTEAELEAAKAIWETGKYGTGQERIDNLLAAGFTEEGARRVQAAIDQFISSNYQWSEAQKEVATTTEESKEETESLSQAITSKFVRSFAYARRTVSTLGDAFFNVGAGIWNIIKMVGESFTRVFDFDIVLKDISDLSYRVKYITEIFRNWTEGNEKLRDIFDEVFKVANSFYRIIRSVGSIAIDVLSSLIQVIGEVTLGFDTSGISISKYTDKIAEWVENFARVLRQGEVFVKIFRVVVTIIKNIIDYAKKLPAALQPFFDRAKKNVVELLEKFKQASGIDILSGIQKAADTVKKFFEIMSNPFAKGADGRTEISRWASDVKNSILNAFSSPVDIFKKIKEWFKKGFEKVREQPTSIIPKNLIKRLFHGFSEFIKEMSTVDYAAVLKTVRNIAGVVLVISSIITSMKIQKLYDTIQKPAESIKNMVSSIVGVFNSFKDMGKRVTKAAELNLLAGAFVHVATGVAIMSASIVGLGMVDTEVLVKGLVAITAVVAGLAGVILTYNKTVQPNMMRLIDTNLVQIGITVGIMAGVIYALGKLSYEHLAKGLIMLTTIGLMFEAITVVNSRFSTPFKNDIWKSVLALGIAVNGFIPIVKVLGEMRVTDLTKGLMSLELVLLDMSAILLMSTLIADSYSAGDVIKVAGAFALIGAVTNLIIPFVKIVGEMNFIDIVKGLGSLVGVIGMIGLTLSTMAEVMNGGDSLDMIGIAASMSLIMLSLNLMLPTVLALGALSAKSETAVGTAVKNISTLLIVIGGLLTVMGNFNPRAVFVVAVSFTGIAIGLSAMIPAITALAALPEGAIAKAVLAIGTLLGLFTGMIAILAIANAATGESVVVIMGALAVQLAEIAIAFIGGALALSVAAGLIGKAAIQFTASIETFSNLEGSRLEANAKHLVESMKILAVGFRDAAPDIAAAIGTIFGILIGTLTVEIPKLFDAISTVFLSYSEMVVRNLVGLISGILIGVFEGIIEFIEQITEKDGHRGLSLVERGANALEKLFTQIVEKLRPKLDGIAEELTLLTIDILTAYSRALEEHGDALMSALDDAMRITAYYLGQAIDGVADEINSIAGKIIGYIIGGIASKIEQLWIEIDSWVRLTIYKIKHHFGLDMRYSDKSAMYLIGKQLIEDWIEGVKVMFSDAGAMVGAFFGTIKDAFEEETEKFGKEVGVDVSKLKDFIYHTAWGMHSPSDDDVKIGKNIPKGWLQGFMESLGATEGGMTGAISGLKDKLLNAFGLNGFFEGNGFDISSLLGIDPNDTELSITPVLNTDDFDSDYSSFLSQYGGSDYNLGTTAGLAYDIGDSTAGSNGFYTAAPTDVSGLRSDVQDIAERIGRLEVRMDTGALVGALYAGIDEKLGEKQILAGRGVYA